MKILDFLFYYTVQMITSARIRKFRMERIPDQAAYSLAICYSLILFTIYVLFEYICLNTLEAPVSLVIWVSVFLIIYLGLRRIYIIRGRLLLISEKKIAIPKVSENVGKIISILFLVFFYFLPYLVIYLFHKINPFNVHSNW